MPAIANRKVRQHASWRTYFERWKAGPGSRPERVQPVCKDTVGWEPVSRGVLIQSVTRAELRFLDEMAKTHPINSASIAAYIVNFLNQKEGRTRRLRAWHIVLEMTRPEPRQVRGLRPLSQVALDSRQHVKKAAFERHRRLHQHASADQLEKAAAFEPPEQRVRTMALAKERRRQAGGAPVHEHDIWRRYSVTSGEGYDEILRRVTERAGSSSSLRRDCMAVWCHLRETAGLDRNVASRCTTTLAETAELMGLHQSAMSRICSLLAEVGALVKVPDGTRVDLHISPELVYRGHRLDHVTDVLKFMFEIERPYGQGPKALQTRQEGADAASAADAENEPAAPAAEEDAGLLTEDDAGLLTADDGEELPAEASEAAVPPDGPGRHQLSDNVLPMYEMMRAASSWGSSTARRKKVEEEVIDDGQPLDLDENYDVEGEFG